MSHWAHSGVELVVIRNAAGHASIATTSGYMDTDLQALADAVRLTPRFAADTA